MKNAKNTQESFVLTRNSKSVSNDTKRNKTKQKIKNKKRNPFKKGTWKAWFFKKISQSKKSRGVENFHFTKSDNFIIYKNDKLKARIFNKKLSNSDVEKLLKKYPNAVVLISQNNGEFTKISLESYRKLMHVKSIMVSFEIAGYGDDWQVDDTKEDEYYSIYSNEFIIDNINKLMKFIARHRHGIEGIYHLQCMCCWYDIFKYDFKILVVNQDGTTKSFKDDNKFMEYYNLRLF